MQPIKLYTHWGAPNPWKVAIILNELDVPHEDTIVELNETKEKLVTNLSPNGRLPVIHDPNTNVTLWESGAIIQYLIQQYDKTQKLSYSSVPERYLAQQWLAFQISGQGPYFGQATWFVRFHPEKLPSAIERYLTEIVRVIAVLEEALLRNDTGWLVGSKCTYADLAFVTWAGIAEGLFLQLNREPDRKGRFPTYYAWLERLHSRPVVSAALAKIAEGRKAHGLP